MSVSSLGFLLVYCGSLLASVTVAGYWSFITYQLVYLVHPKIRWWAGAIPDLSWSVIAVSLMIFSVLIGKGRESFDARELPYALRWLLVALFINILVWPIAVAPEYHQRILIEFSKLVVVMLMAFRLLDNHKRILNSIWAYLIGCAYLGWEATAHGRNSSGRVEGIGPVDSPDANLTASVMVPAMPIMLVLFATGTNRTRLAVAVIGVYIVNGLVLLNSRGAFIGLISGCAIVLLILLRSPLQRGSRRLVAILAVCAGLAGGLYLTDGMFWERMGTIQNPEEDKTAGANRSYFWLASIKLAKDHPFGSGAGAFNRLGAPYVDREILPDPNTRKSVHSTWFQALSDVGWIGLGVLLVIIYTALRGSSAARQQAYREGDTQVYWIIVALETGFVAYLVSASFIDRYRAEILYWMIMYLSCVYSLRNAKQHGEVPVS